MEEAYIIDAKSIENVRVHKVEIVEGMEVRIIGRVGPRGELIAEYSLLFSRAGNLMEIFMGDATGHQAAAKAKQIRGDWPWLLYYEHLYFDGQYWAVIEWYVYGDGHQHRVGHASTVIYGPGGRELVVGAELSAEQVKGVIQNMKVGKYRAPDIDAGDDHTP